MREFRSYGSVRGARSNARPYRDSDQPDRLVLTPHPFVREPLVQGSKPLDQKIDHQARARRQMLA